MKVIDARSGERMIVGRILNYPDLESVTLLEVKAGLFEAQFTVRSTLRDHRTGKLVTKVQQVRGPIRFLHPSFMFERVAFFPS